MRKIAEMTSVEERMALDAMEHGGKEFERLANQLRWKARVGKDGKRLTHMVAESGKVDLARVLANAGHDFEAADDSGQTPLLAMLMMAEKEGKMEGEMLDWLIQRAASHGSLKRESNLDGVIRGGGLHAENEKGWDALSCALMRNDVDSMGKLLKAGADVNAKSMRDGWTVLMRAAESGNMQGLAFLLDRGAKVDDRNGYGQTALWLANRQGFEGVVRELLQAGADWREQDINGMTGLAVAVKSRHVECVKELLKAGADPTWQARVGDVDVEKLAMMCGNEEMREVVAKGVMERKAEDQEVASGLVDLARKLRESRAKGILGNEEANNGMKWME